MVRSAGKLTNINKVPRYQSYIICTSPRSGSTLLCRLLAATGQCGKPDSHFHSPSISDWAGYYKITPDNYESEQDLLTAIFQAARDRGTANTGMFGLRMQSPSFDFFMRKLSLLCPGCSGDYERIEKAFGRTLIIHLTRTNKLDQAISFVKADQTGLWHKAPDGTELERTAAVKKPIYDANAIAFHLAELTNMDAAWTSWFAKEQIDPVRINYDDLSASPMDVTIKIHEHMDLPLKITHSIGLPVAKLADSTNKRWAKRFLAETHTYTD